MGRFDGVLLATDYDDTLYSTTHTISEENRAAIAYFISQGGLFTISTGRSYTNFAIQMEREALPLNTPAILSNGAQIYDFQENALLYEAHMSQRVGKDMEQVCTMFPDLGFEAYHEERVYIHNPNSVTRRHLDRAGLVGIPAEIREMPLPWIKAILQQENHELLLEVQAYMQTLWPEDYEVIFSNAVLLELTARGSHKGSAVLWLAERLGVSPRHIYCIGNGQNDIPMLAVAEKAFVPANCAPALRHCGATMLPSCDESCVARMIDCLKEWYPEN